MTTILIIFCFAIVHAVSDAEPMVVPIFVALLLIFGVWAARGSFWSFFLNAASTVVYLGSWIAPPMFLVGGLDLMYLVGTLGYVATIYWILHYPRKPL